MVLSKQRAEELAKLLNEINAHLDKADESAWERLRRYRSAGEALIRAKKILVQHGRWTTWIKENFKRGLRQAEKYIKFAKTKSAPEADLEDEEELWRQASARGKKGSTPSRERPKDGKEIDAGVLDLVPEDIVPDLKTKLDALRTKWGNRVDANSGVTVAAIKYAHKEVCGG